MAVRKKAPVREPIPSAYSTTALYQCPTSGVKSSTITHAIVSNSSNSDVEFYFARVVAAGSPGSGETVTNEYIGPKIIPAKNSQVISKVIGMALLPGEFVNERCSINNALSISLSVEEALQD
jgi:hypothetical protein